MELCTVKHRVPVIVPVIILVSIPFSSYDIMWELSHKIIAPGMFASYEAKGAGALSFLSNALAC